MKPSQPLSSTQNQKATTSNETWAESILANPNIKIHYGTLTDDKERYEIKCLNYINKNDPKTNTNQK